MERKPKTTSSIYRKIAFDIAKNIADGRYTEGQRLYGRSVLASQYTVSPETIRKAIYILKDMGIVETEKGSGIEVVSAVKAREFIQYFTEVETIAEVANDVTMWARRQAKENAEIVEKIQFVVDTAQRLKNVNPLTPFEFYITKESTVIGKTADELRFWHNTGGTIIAIKRGESLIVSPGPYATFQEGDTFYVIGNDQAYAAAFRLMFE